MPGGLRGVAPLRRVDAAETQVSVAKPPREPTEGLSMSVSDTPRNRGNADAPHMSPVTPAEDVRSIAINDISWGAVLAGVVVALVAQLILNMIGIGVGASTLDPGAGPNENPSAQGFSIGAGIWWTVSGVVASLA